MLWHFQTFLSYWHVPIFKAITACLSQVLCGVLSGLLSMVAYHHTYLTTQILPALRSQGDDYNHIMVESLADRLAEAFAEKLHQIVRKDLWGYAPNEDFTTEDLLKVKYQGEPLETDLHHCQHHAKADNTYHTGKNSFRTLKYRINLGLSCTYPALRRIRCKQ